MTIQDIRIAIASHNVTHEVETAILVEARKILSEESAWCRRHAAVDANCMDVAPHSGAACKWCIMGALHRVCKTENYDDIPFNITYALRQVIHGEIAEFNDSPVTTHKDVLEMMDKAIERTKK
jgi:hypothetical protein